MGLFDFLKPTPKCLFCGGENMLETIKIRYRCDPHTHIYHYHYWCLRDTLNTVSLGGLDVEHGYEAGEIAEEIKRRRESQKRRQNKYSELYEFLGGNDDC